MCTTCTHVKYTYTCVLYTCTFYTIHVIIHVHVYCIVYCIVYTCACTYVQYTCTYRCTVHVYACYVYNLIFFRLNENYLLEDGVCLPRSTIYEHYLDFCERELIQPVNAASFGKVTSSTIS